MLRLRKFRALLAFDCVSNVTFPAQVLRYVNTEVLHNVCVFEQISIESVWICDGVMLPAYSQCLTLVRMKLHVPDFLSFAQWVLLHSFSIFFATDDEIDHGIFREQSDCTIHAFGYVVDIVKKQAGSQHST